MLSGEQSQFSDTEIENEKKLWSEKKRLNQKILRNKAKKLFEDLEDSNEE